MLQVNKNVVANFIGKGWAALMSFLFIPFYIKLMGIEAYGLVGVYIALSAVFSLFDLGLGTTLNREFARLSTDKRNEQYMLNLLKTLETLYWCLAFIAGITVILLSSLIANHWINSGSLDVNIISYFDYFDGVCYCITASFLIIFRWFIRSAAASDT